MPIISKGGRRNWKVRMIYLLMYGTLIAGAVTMVYPFALMVGGSVTTRYDFDDFAVVPRYLYNDDALLKKYLHSKYGQNNFQSLAFLYGRDCEWLNWSDIRAISDFSATVFAAEKTALPHAAVQVGDWQEFKKSVPAKNKGLFFETDNSAYQNSLQRRYLAEYGTEQQAIAALNHKWGRSFTQFAEILPMMSQLYAQRWYPPERPDFDDYLYVVAGSPPERQQLPPLRELWGRYLLLKYTSPENYRQATGVSIHNFSEVPLRTGSDWNEFLLRKYPLRLVTVDSKGMPADPARRSEWMDNLLKTVPVDKWELNDPATCYHRFLAGKYGTVEELNRVHQTAYKTFDEVKLPYQLEDYYTFTQQKSQLRIQYFSGNYQTVANYLMTKGRAVTVTSILVVLALLSALTINPLAAYALSRGKAAISNKLLIFFLATMAFPAEVAMIPGFLLIRDLGLLNTFGALLLPTLANGYSIFLLKGFFDSIPRELYEAADIDGAGEFTKFRVITLPMAKPILAVIALGAFNSAYGGFMWAFLTCQDPRMWTIMVWIYDLQSRTAEQGIVMASLVLASLPTLLVFIFCQKIIMRGIVIPTMK